MLIGSNYKRVSRRLSTRKWLLKIYLLDILRGITSTDSGGWNSTHVNVTHTQFTPTVKQDRGTYRGRIGDAKRPLFSKVDDFKMAKLQSDMILAFMQTRSHLACSHTTAIRTHVTQKKAATSYSALNHRFGSFRNL